MELKQGTAVRLLSSGSELNLAGKAPGPMRKRILIAVAAVVIVLIAAPIVALHVFAPKIHTYLLDRTEAVLRTHFASDVEIVRFFRYTHAARTNYDYRVGASSQRPHGHPAADSGEQGHDVHDAAQHFEAQA